MLKCWNPIGRGPTCHLSRHAQSRTASGAREVLQTWSFTPARIRSNRSPRGLKSMTACRSSSSPSARLSNDQETLDGLWPKSPLTSTTAAAVATPHMKRGPAFPRVPSSASPLRRLFSNGSTDACSSRTSCTVPCRRLLLQLVVGNNFPFVLRVLQVVLAKMIPHLRNHLAPRQRIADQISASSAEG